MKHSLTCHRGLLTAAKTYSTLFGHMWLLSTSETFPGFLETWKRNFLNSAPTDVSFRQRGRRDSRRQEDPMKRCWKKIKKGHDGSSSIRAYRTRTRSSQAVPQLPAGSKGTVWPIFEHSQGHNRDISHICTVEIVAWRSTCGIWFCFITLL